MTLIIETATHLRSQRMTNVIPLRKKPKNIVDDVVNQMRMAYLQSGLTDEGANEAAAELRPYLIELGEEIKAEMQLPAELGLTDIQRNAIAKAHYECFQHVHERVSAKMQRAEIIIASLVGRVHV